MQSAFNLNHSVQLLWCVCRSFALPTRKLDFAVLKLWWRISSLKRVKSHPAGTVSTHIVTPFLGAALAVTSTEGYG